MSGVSGTSVSMMVAILCTSVFPLWPVETAERLMALGWPTLAGNHERQLLTQDLRQMGPTDAATATMLTPRIRA